VSWRPDQLVALAARISGARELDPGEVELLLGPRWESQRHRSAINNDGSPMQVCISLRKGEAVVRLVGDPVAYETDPRTRATEAIRHGYRLARKAGDASGRTMFHATVSAILPEPMDRHRLHRGPLWLAVDAARGPGFAAYFTTSWEAEELRPQRVVRWLDGLLEHCSAATSIVASAATSGIIAAVGLEGHSSRDMRLKVYWYLREGVDPFSLGILPRSPFESVLETARQGRSLGSDGILVSCAFDASGEERGVKLDLCGHCLHQPRAKWRTLLDGLSQRFDLTQLPRTALEEAPSSVEPAFLSLVQEEGRHRINLYLKEPQFHAS